MVWERFIKKNYLNVINANLEPFSLYHLWWKDLIEVSIIRPWKTESERNGFLLRDVKLKKTFILYWDMGSRVVS